LNLLLATHRTRLAIASDLTRPNDTRHRGCRAVPERRVAGGTWNARVGFYRANKARKRDFSDTKTGRAMFVPPKHLSATGFADEPGLLRLMTLRSNDQFNTTIYGYEDRLRDVSGTRDIVFMDSADIEQFGLFDGKVVGIATEADDAIIREKHGLKVFAYDVPRGCIGGYYPECNVLIPLSHHAEESKVPAGKSVPVRIIQ
jgi:anaerobic selenocysteine-containing dehydrogenase